MKVFLAFMVVAITWSLPPASPQWPWLPMISLVPAGAWLVRRNSPLAGLLGLLAGLAGVAWEAQQEQTLLAVPVPAQSALVFGVVADREDRADSTLLLLADALVDGQPVPGLLRLTGRKARVTALPGDQVQVTVRFHARRNQPVEVAFDFARYLLGQGVSLSGSLVDPHIASLAATGQWRWNRVRQEISQRVYQAVPPEQRGLTEAMLVGKRGWLERALQEQLQAAGIYHLISISGLHLGLVAGWSFVACRLLLVLLIPVARRWDVKPLAAFLSIWPMLGYALLSGWSVATQRAAVMVLVFLIGVMLRRSHQSWRALMFAAIILLCWQPSQLYDAGFQLSFLAVATILAGLQLWSRFGIRNRLLEEGFISLLVGVVLSPVVSHHFHMVSWYGLPANLLTVPWCGVSTVPLGMFSLMAWPFSPDMFDILANWMATSLEPMRWVAQWHADLPGGWWRTPGPPLLALAASLAVTTLIPMFHRHRLALALLAGALTFWPRSILAPGQLLLAVLDVGQAQAVLLRGPAGNWQVIDAGGVNSPRFNVGEGTISPFLWQAGASRLSRLIITHPQQDHMAGASRLLQNFPTRELWIGHFPDEEAHDQAYQHLLTVADRQGTRVVRVAAGDAVEEEGVGLQVLHPPRDGRHRSVNNSALALMVTHGDTRLLLPADLEKGALKELLRSGQSLRADVALAAHHGAASSLLKGWPEQVRPKHLLISVGLHNRFHFPHPRIMQSWTRVGARIWRTDQEGNLLFVGDGHAMTPLTRP